MKILILLKSSLDNDSRVRKEINTLMMFGHTISLISVGSKIDGLSFHHNSIYFVGKRRWLPGISLVLSYVIFIKNSLSLYNRHDVVHCHDLNTLFTGTLIKWLNKRVKLVYDSHEFAINDIPNQSWWSIKARYCLERFLIRRADEVIVVSDSIANEYARMYSIKKPHLVLNCPPYVEQVKKDLFRQRLGIRRNQVIFLYQGGLSKGRGIEVLLQAFEQSDDDRCVLVCMGYGPLEGLVREFAQRCPLIHHHPAAAQNVLLDHTSSADFGVSLIEDSCLSYRYCLPNKLFEYLMAGLPVITSDLPEMKRLVESESIGLVAESNTVAGFQTVLEEALDMNIERACENIKRIRRIYCWEAQMPALENAYGVSRPKL